MIFIDGVVYTTTSSGCGAAPNGVWAIDLDGREQGHELEDRRPEHRRHDGPAFGADGTIYVATAALPADATASRRRTTYANAIVALDRATLQPKDWFSAPGVEFNASPIVIRTRTSDLVAVTANDGRLYLLDGAALGGTDHKTPLHVTAKYTPLVRARALAAWVRRARTGFWRRLPALRRPASSSPPNGVAPTGSIVAFKVTREGGGVTLEPGWASRNLTSPLAPIVVNGVVFAVSSGEYRGSGATTHRRPARATLDSGGALRAGRRHRQAALEQRHDDHVVCTRRTLGRRRARCTS